jgi:hypothetical protein
MGRRAQDLNGSGGMVNRKEDVVGDEATGGPDFGREEVRGDDGGGVSLQEPLPGRAPAAFGRRLDPVALQDGLDRVRRDVMAKVQEGALDLVVAPGGVLGREPDDERLDLLAGISLPTGPRGLVGPLRCDEPSVPREDRVGGDDRSDRLEDPPAEGTALPRQTPALGVGKLQPRRSELRTEDPCSLRGGSR